jgi:acetyl-CoA/propionyl-CoA carboxylase, biotin carboxylase, biotin carboxyl carrier protein
VSTPVSLPFDTVLVANRGEIAVRVIRTLRRLGLRSVAVFSEADRAARHVAEADLAVRLGPAAASESYLHVGRVVDAAQRTGAGALHPGYGFLAENPALAEACAAAGVTFVGPPPSAMAAMGDKIRAKQAVAAAGVAVVPGRTEAGMTDDDLAAAAAEVGYPVLLKPSAGGGGKGMRLVQDPADLPDAIAGARREALASFGDGALLVERFVTRPRHVEVQVLADVHGSVVHLGERECSLQRRHQKIVEEAPSPLLGGEARADLGARAVAVARACGYVNAGTVEFVVSDGAPGEPYFLEMNTRLQVEHPVTEAVFGVDLVELQLRIAAGEALPFTQDELAPSGHAVEARVYAEDPARGFVPTGGRVLALREPRGDGVRVDSALAVGSEVGSDYDPMLAKVIAWGTDRAQALARLDAALAATAVLGVTTNVGFVRALLAHADVAAGRLHTALVEEAGPDLAPDDVPDHVVAAGALLDLATPPAAARSRWDVLDGWRLGEPAWARWRAEVAGAGSVDAWVRHDRGSGTLVRVGDGDAVPAVLEPGPDAGVVLHHGGLAESLVVARHGATTWIGHGGRAWALTEPEPTSPGEAAAAHGGAVRSPMPGSVTAVAVAAGDHVVAGQAIVVVEAMKMEHTLVAPCDGVVTELTAATGAQVALDEVLAVIDPIADAQAGSAVIEREDG